MPSQLRRDDDERVIQVSEEVLGVVGRNASLRPKTTRPQQSRELCPQTEFERHGFIAKETAALIRKFASIKAAHFELEPSEEIRRWYVALSCFVQRANAKILRGEAVPGRGASVPSRLLVGGQRDLALCGA